MNFALKQKVTLRGSYIPMTVVGYGNETVEVDGLYYRTITCGWMEGDGWTTADFDHRLLDHMEETEENLPVPEVGDIVFHNFHDKTMVVASVIDVDKLICTWHTENRTLITAEVARDHVTLMPESGEE